jgi:hypothetical protein
MQVINTTGKFQGPKDYRAQRPYQVKPLIVGGRYEGETLIAYVCKEGREWDPATYDRLYSAPKGKLKGKYFKGTNPDRKRVY